MPQNAPNSLPLFTLPLFTPTPRCPQAEVEEDPDNEFTSTSKAPPPLDGPRIIDVGIGGPGFHPLKWRRAWRDKARGGGVSGAWGGRAAQGGLAAPGAAPPRAPRRAAHKPPRPDPPPTPPPDPPRQVLPALLKFDPDIIFVSAGFDAHRKDEINFRREGGGGRRGAPRARAAAARPRPPASPAHPVSKDPPPAATLHPNPPPTLHPRPHPPPPTPCPPPKGTSAPASATTSG